VEIKRYQSVLFLLFTTFAPAGMKAQEMKYPPLSEYLMPQADEVALAKSAAPQNISDHASIRVFTASGYQIVHEGDNGFVCMVMRGFTGAPTFTPVQVRGFITYDAKTRAPICLSAQAVRTVLPYYDLRTKLGLVGHWHPHMMVYLPNYENSMLGNNDPGSHLPGIGDDAGTPFAVGTIPVDDKLAIKVRP